MKVTNHTVTGAGSETRYFPHCAHVHTQTCQYKVTD